MKKAGSKDALLHDQSNERVKSKEQTCRESDVQKNDAQKKPKKAPSAQRLSDKTTEFLDAMIRRILLLTPSTANQNVLVKSEIVELCLRVREQFLLEQSFIDVDPPVFVFGDLHGQLLDLLRMLHYTGLPPKRNFLFLGDLVDRGAHSMETVTLLLAFKLRHPKHVHILRGNHETRCVNRQYGFYDECQRKFPEDGIELWTQFQHVFNCLPIAGRIGRRIFCAHGGISEDLKTFKQLTSLKRPTDICDLGLLCDLLWSDPSPSTGGYSPSPRGVSQIFGKVAVEEFCQKMKIDVIVRAHQCVKDGYEFFADRKCLTIFSAPYYCGEVDNAAGILMVSRKLVCRVLTFKPPQKKEDNKETPTTTPTTTPTQ